MTLRNWLTAAAVAMSIYVVFIVDAQTHEQIDDSLNFYAGDVAEAGQSFIRATPPEQE